MGSSVIANDYSYAYNKTNASTSLLLRNMPENRKQAELLIGVINQFLINLAHRLRFLVLSFFGFGRGMNGFFKPATRFRFNELNLKHDHCGYPEFLDRDVWSCVCPMPYTKIGRDCVCLGCMAEVSEDKYWEKAWDSFLDFAEDELKDDTEDGKKEDRDFSVDSNNSSRRNMRQVPVWRSLSPVLGSETAEGGKDNNDENSEIHEVSARRLFRQDSNYLTIMRADGKPKVLRPSKFKPFKIANNMNDMNLLWLKKKSELNNLEQIETSSTAKPEKMPEPPSHTDVQEVPLEVSTELSTEPVPEQSKNEWGTFSDSVIFGETSGSAFSGADRAFGTLSAHKGTGSMALGAKNGSGAAVGFTGEGHSEVGIQSDGAEASGSVMVGPKAKKASSTMTMMSGKGDAVATNTLTDDASGSAVALATQGAASSSSAAFGAAIAGAAAAPGKGEAGGSSSYGRNATISATVKGRDMISETISMGNANDSLREALASSSSEDMQRRKETSEVRQQEEKTFEFFGGENEPDEWFDN